MAVFCCPRIPRQQKILYQLLHQYLEYVSDGHVHRRQHHNRLFSGDNTAEYLPILTAAAILSSLVSFMGSVYIVTKRSSLSFLTTAAGALFNIILNFLLIPTHLGIYGAAIATLCSYLLSFLIRIVSIRNILPFRLYGGRLFMSVLIIAVQIISSSLGGHLNTGIQLSCFLSLAVINIHPLITYVKSKK